MRQRTIRTQGWVIFSKAGSGSARELAGSDLGLVGERKMKISKKNAINVFLNQILLKNFFFLHKHEVLLKKLKIQL